MPLYEYRCQACGKEVERLVSYKASDLQSCHECGARLTRKVSFCNFTIKPTGRGMALDTLNSGVVGGRRKQWAENAAAQGL